MIDVAELSERQRPSQIMGGPRLAVVVPCYNEEGAIEETVAHLRGVLECTDYELIVVNDGSTDRTAAILEEISVRDPALVVLTHDPNRGYGAALKTGIVNANAPLIAIADADGSYPIDRLPELVDAMDGHDMVVGARTGANVVYSKIRAIPKIFLRRWASWIARQEIPDINSGLRVFRRETALQYLPILPSGFSFTTTITLCMLTNYRKVAYIPIDYSPRIGKSKIQPIRDTLRFIVLIARTGMYFAPVRVLAPVVLVMALAAMVSAVIDIARGNLTDTTVILTTFTLNVALFSLLADMIDKRTSR